VTSEEIIAIIRRHIVALDARIEDLHNRIQVMYDVGFHTNVDAKRAAIERCEQRKIALETVLSEIGEEV
jgi:hypothetical protein